MSYNTNLNMLNSNALVPNFAVNQLGSKPTNINNIPDDIINCIFQNFLEADEIREMGLVNHYWHKIIKNQNLWKLLCQRDCYLPASQIANLEPYIKAYKGEWNRIYQILKKGVLIGFEQQVKQKMNGSAVILKEGIFSQNGNLTQGKITYTHSLFNIKTKKIACGFFDSNEVLIQGKQACVNNEGIITQESEGVFENSSNLESNDIDIELNHPKFGKITNSDGEVLIGVFTPGDETSEDEKFEGKRFLPNGDIWEGTFSYNEDSDDYILNGKGKVTFLSGEVLEGIFEDNQLKVKKNHISA